MKLGPDSADAHNNLGACYFHLKDYAAAEPELLKAVALNPEFSYAYVNLGLVQGSLQKLEAAKQDFRQALAAKPTDPAVYMRVADFFEQLKDPLDAITAYAGTLKLDPNLTDARARRPGQVRGRDGIG